MVDVKVWGYLCPVVFPTNGVHRTAFYQLNSDMPAVHACTENLGRQRFVLFLRVLGVG